MERLVRGNDVLDSRDSRALPWRRAGGDEDVPGADFVASRNEPHCTRVLEHGAALDQFDPGALERGGIGELEPRDLAVLVGDELAPIEDRLANAPAVAGRVLEIVGITRGVDQELLGNAAADHAGAADPVFLRDHDLGAVTGCNACGTHAAGTRADNEKIDFSIGHRQSTISNRRSVVGPDIAAHTETDL